MPAAAGGAARCGGLASSKKKKKAPKDASAAAPAPPQSHIGRRRGEPGGERSLSVMGISWCGAGEWRCRVGCNGSRLARKRTLAEREGFEPSDEFNPINRLAGGCLRPLGHLSVGSRPGARPGRAFDSRHSTASRGPAPPVNASAGPEGQGAAPGPLSPPHQVITSTGKCARGGEFTGAMRPRARGRGRTPAMSCALLRLAFCAMLAILGSVCFAALWARLCCFGRTDRGLHQPICVLFLGGSEELMGGEGVPS